MHCTANFKFKWFLGPADQNELYHTPLLSKIWGLGDRTFFVVVILLSPTFNVHIPNNTYKVTLLAFLKGELAHDCRGTSKMRRAVPAFEIKLLL